MSVATQEELFLRAMAGQSEEYPEPITRKEQFYAEIIERIKGGGASPTEIKKYVDEYLEAHPVEGITEEKANEIVEAYYSAHITEDIKDKVDKVDGKGLSTNDYADEDKEKLDGIDLSLYVKKTDLKEPLVFDNTQEWEAYDKTNIKNGTLICFKEKEA